MSDQELIIKIHATSDILSEETYTFLFDLFVKLTGCSNPSLFSALNGKPYKTTIQKDPTEFISIARSSGVFGFDNENETISLNASIQKMPNGMLRFQDMPNRQNEISIRISDGSWIEGLNAIENICLSLGGYIKPNLLYACFPSVSNIRYGDAFDVSGGLRDLYWITGFSGTILENMQQIDLSDIHNSTLNMGSAYAQLKFNDDPRECIGDQWSKVKDTFVKRHISIFTEQTAIPLQSGVHNVGLIGFLKELFSARKSFLHGSNKLNFQWKY